MKNFIPINRKLFNNFLWTERRKFSKFEAWLDLLQLVSYTDDNKQLIHGILCEWKRGQFPISISFLMKRWKWTEKPVRNFLKILQNDEMISLEKGVKWSMLTICKYESYNKTGQAEVSQRSTTGQAEVSQRSIIKESKEVKESKKGEEEVISSSSDSLFSIFELKEKYLKNKKLVSAVVNNPDNKFNNEKHLELQMDKFIQELKERNELIKKESDFASHFRNWNRKFKHSSSKNSQPAQLNFKNPNKQ